MDRIGIFASLRERSLVPTEAVSSKGSPFEGVSCFFASLGQEIAQGEGRLNGSFVCQLAPEEILPLVEGVLLQERLSSEIEEESAFFAQYFEIDEEFILEELAEDEVEILSENPLSEVDAFFIEMSAQDDSDQHDRHPSEEESDPD